MSKQKHFTTEQEIIQSIDEARRHIAWCNEEAEILHRWANVLREYPGRSIQLIDMREKANKLTARANRIQDRKLKRLSRALAEFRTMTLPGVTTDGSVAM